MEAAASLAERNFFAVAGEPAPSPMSLAELTGDRSYIKDNWTTDPARRISAAWATPLPDLTVAQVRVLTAQRLATSWLAAPVARFAIRNPAIEVEHYPGDLTLAALWAFPELLGVEPGLAVALADLDYSWMAQAYADDEELSEHAAELISVARALTDPLVPNVR
jgi:hypothetical protein